jgi:protein-L-isoaspartate(D-aspartate) O-methyltransferase
MTSSADAPKPVTGAPSAPPLFDSEQVARCRAMVETQLRPRGIHDARVLAAMLAVPRHAFVPSQFAAHAYDDEPLSIGEGQTISQPFVVASMTEALRLSGGERVLEIGAGSGYQTAVLSLLAREVIAVETLPSLAESARHRLAQLGYNNARIEVGDGTLGWPVEVPFDAILVTAAAPEIPSPLLAQLAEGGRMVLPVGPPQAQELLRVTRREGSIVTERFYPCRFVPLIGRYGFKE